MLTLGKLVTLAERFDDNASTLLSQEQRVAAVRDAVSDFWNSSEWPWHKAEASVTLKAPYSTGTLSVTQGSTTVTGSGTTWDTTWNTPLLIRIGEGDPYLVTAVASTTSLTLAEGYVGESDTGLSYEILHLCYDLPTDFGSMSGPVAAGNQFIIQPTRRETWQKLLTLGSASGTPCEYALRYDDVYGEVRQIVFHPPPAGRDVVRFVYKRQFPRLEYYSIGTAAVANGNTAVTGTGTAWTTMGFSAAGLALQFPQTQSVIYGLVSTAGSATGITLTSNWAGPTISPARAYHLSSLLPIPDRAETCLSHLIRNYVYLMKGWSNSAEKAFIMYERSLSHLMDAPLDPVQHQMPGTSWMFAGPGDPQMVVVQ